MASVSRQTQCTRVSWSPNRPILKEGIAFQVYVSEGTNPQSWMMYGLPNPVSNFFLMTTWYGNQGVPLRGVFGVLRSR